MQTENFVPQEHERYNEIQQRISAWQNKTTLKNKRVIVTRHNSMSQFLIEFGIALEYDEVFSHVKPKDVSNSDVLGVLPLYLAHYANTVTVIELSIPTESRGQQLTLENIFDFFIGIKTYDVNLLY